MANIEQSGIFARPYMFGHDAFILDRHVVARKFDHAGAFVTMPSVERQFQYFDEFEFEFVFFAHISPFKEVQRPTPDSAKSAAPSVTDT